MLTPSQFKDVSRRRGGAGRPLLAALPLVRWVSTRPPTASSSSASAPLASSRSGGTSVNRNKKTTIRLVRHFSSSSPSGSRGSGGGGFKIPAHVAAFGMMLAPALAFFAYYEAKGGKRHAAEERLEDELRGRYKQEIALASSKNKNLAEHYRRAILGNHGGPAKKKSAGYGEDDDEEDDGNASTTDDSSNSSNRASNYEDKIDELLKAGKGGKKRIAAVDEKLYGTAEGLQSLKERDRRMAEHRAARMQEKEEGLANKKAGRKKKKRRKKSIADEDHGTTSSEPEKEPFSLPKISLSQSQQQVLTVAAVATVAAAVGFIAGGGSSKRS